MKKDIILCGVGGQGILSIATVIGEAAMNCGLDIKQAEVHGMSQRGGDVQSNLRLSDKPINSDLIPEGEADLIISMEPMEALRYLPFLAKDGWIISSTVPFINIPNYPDPEKLIQCIQSLPHAVLLDIDTIAKENQLPRGANMVLLGASLKALGIDYEKIKEAVAKIFGSKGDDVVAANCKAMELGREEAEKQH